MLLLLPLLLLLLLLGSEEVGSFKNSSGGRSHTLLGGFPAVQWEAWRGHRDLLAFIPLKSSMAVGSPNALAGHWGTKGCNSITYKAWALCFPNALVGHWGNKGPLGFHPA